MKKKCIKMTNGGFLPKFGFSMKPFLFCITLAIMLIQSYEGYAQNTKITLDIDKVSLEQALSEIESKTDFKFLVNRTDIDLSQQLSIKARDEKLKTVLERLFAGKGISFEVLDKQIILKKQTPAYLEVALTKVKGRVTDKDGLPLPGATVLIKGTYKGITTDANGNYGLKVPVGSVLVFSFVGYQKQEIIISDENTEVNVVMEEEVAELGEVAVISTGYQKIKPEQSTGSISTIRAKEFNSRINTTDFLTGLTNKIPGLLINSDIEFEGNSLFQIRGISTITGNKDPLIVVDGFPTELSLDMINPNEIESVTVLKDAAAATVYGVRASNGVIVIERKKAKAGKVKVDFRSTASFTPKQNYDRYRWDKDASNTSIDYYRIANENNFPPFIWTMMNNHPSDYPAPGLIMAQQSADVISQEEADLLFDELGSYNNIKDYGRLFLRTASTQTYNLNISGGDKNLLYYLMANYSTNDLSEIKNNNNNLLLSARATVKFSKRFSLDLNTDFRESKENSVPIPDINNIYPYERFQDGDGNSLPLYNGSYVNPYYNSNLISMGLLDNMYYPLVDINEISDKTHTLSNRITANFRYELGKGFNLSFGGVYETSRTDARYLASENSSEVHQYINRYTENGTNGFIYNIPKGGFLKQGTNSTTAYTLRAQLNYNKQIHKDHSLNVILGGEIRNIIGKSSFASYFGYSDLTLLQQPVNYDLLGDPYYFPSYARGNPRLSYDELFGQGYVKNRYVSAYSNVVYAYQGKYSFTGSMRIDQSNLFGTDPKYRYKPLWSVGAAWNIHKEDFMQDLSWLESLKLRMAYGFSGNVAKNSLPQVIAKADINPFHPIVNLTLNLLSYANSGLRWEETRNLNIGIDYTIFKNIRGSIEYYSKKSTDLLATNQIDASKGGSFALVNEASVRNNGLEISLHADWISRRDFNWNTGFVFSHNTSKVLDVYNEKLDDLESKSTDYVKGSYSNYLKGYPIGALFNYRYAGISADGIPLVYDENGEAVELLPFSSSFGKEYLDYAGTSIPAFNMGLSNRVDIRNFYVYCMINFYGGFKVRVPVPSGGDVRPLKGAANYWKEPGDEADPGVLPSPKESYIAANLAYTDRYMVNGTYLTLGDLTLAYSFRNSKLVKKTGISNLEVRAQASNLFTVGFNKYNYSLATGSYAKSYLTPTYTVSLHVNF